MSLTKVTLLRTTTNTDAVIDFSAITSTVTCISLTVYNYFTCFKPSLSKSKADRGVNYKAKAHPT